LIPRSRNSFLTELYNEIVPTITTKDAKDFADAVISRFLNPYVHHALMSIALNSVSKYKERDLPTVLDDLKAGKDPKHLLFALAALIKFYDGYRIKNGQKEAIALKDTPEYLVEFRKYWDAYYAGGKLEDVVHSVLANETFWGEDLTKVERLGERGCP
jgi:tagaturonate reductase